MYNHKKSDSYFFLSFPGVTVPSVFIVFYAYNNTDEIFKKKTIFSTLTHKLILYSLVFNFYTFEGNIPKTIWEVHNTGSTT